MTETVRFALPFLSPGQAQKEWFHNEALQRIDLLLCALVESEPASTPPADPVVGSCYAVGDGASGDWAGHDGALAAFLDGGWTFIEPREGLRALVRGSGLPLVRKNNVWEIGIVRADQLRIGDDQVVGSRQPAIASPSGGATVDAECRNALSAVLSALAAHGLVES